jgi:hypothetical protein
MTRSSTLTLDRCLTSAAPRNSFRLNASSRFALSASRWRRSTPGRNSHSFARFLVPCRRARSDRRRSCCRRRTLASVDGTPYVGFVNFGPPTRVYVKRLNGTGTAWESVGGALNVNGAQSAEEPAMAVIGTTPYVAWRESTAGGDEQIRVKRLGAGDTWEEPIPGPLNLDPSRYAFNPELAAVDGTLHVVFREPDGAGVDQIHVLRPNAAVTDWEEVVPGSLNVDQSEGSQGPDIAVLDGVPWVAWRERAPPWSSCGRTRSQARAEKPQAQPTFLVRPKVALDSQ